ncbi:MAG: mechanosensitive ion channel family protein [Actinomycetia bacterium]|nr:mechanosensitive ion channel family protein [Actinomycetes bacterium]
MAESIGEFLSTLWAERGFEILATIATFVGALILIAVIRRALDRWQGRVTARLIESEAHDDRERGQRLVTLTDVARLVTNIVVWSIVILTIMGIWGIPMTPFVAVGATIGIAVGFGAQDVVRDVIAGFLILLENQYAIGDVVTIAGVDGTVEAIRLRTTVLRDISGNVHHVPNGQIKVASNLTSDFARYVADIPVSYDTDVDRAMEVILDEAMAMAAAPEWSKKFVEEPAMLGVNELADSSVNIRLLMTVVTEDRWVIKREFLRRIKNRLDDEGIEIPYAYMNVVIQGDRPGQA